MRTKRLLILALTLVGLVALGFGIRAYLAHEARAATGKGAGESGGKPGGKEGGGKEGAGGPDRVVPVVAAKVEARDVPIYLEGLGTVAAYNTVTVKSQVEGRIDKITFEEGQTVHRGDLLAQIDPRPFNIQLQTANAGLARDQATLRAHQATLARILDLRKDGLASQQQADDEQAAVAQSEATLKSDQAQIGAARLQLDYARITSPIDGVTGVRQIDQGNIVHPGDATGIVVVTQLDPITVLFTLPQDDLPRISKKMADTKLSVEAWSREGEISLGKGEVTLIDNQINQATATIKLKSVFPNPARALWPNQFVKARLLLDVRKGALVLPAPAVQRGPQGTFVYVIEKDQKANPRPIKVASMQGDLALIAEGLTAGDQVVVDGQFQLRPGSKVAVRPAEPVKPEAPPGRSAGEARDGGAP